MEKPASKLVEEAVLAVKQGEINLENGEIRFGAAWPEIRGEVALILDLEKAGQFFKTTLPAFEMDKVWTRVLPDLTFVQTLPVTGGSADGGGPALRASLDSLKVYRLGPEVTPAPTAGPATPAKEPNPKPVSLPAHQKGRGKWRKPLAWAAAIVLIVVLSFSSLAGVANAAEPGDFFYGAKLFLDNARQVVAFSPQDKKDFALSYCAHRQEELEWLVKNNRLQYFGEVASDYQQTLQKAFSGNTISNQEAGQLKNQQARLTELSGQLAAVNAAGSSQASAEVNKMVQQLNLYQDMPQQNSPLPTTTPDTSNINTPALTPTSGPATTPGVSPATASSPAITDSGTVPGTSVPVAPPGTTTEDVNPTVVASDIIAASAAPTTTSAPAPGGGEPTATPVPGEGGPGSMVNHNPTPTQVVAGDGDGNNNSNGSGNNNGAGDEGQQNTGGNTPANNSSHSQGSTGQPATPPNAHTTPTAKPAKPTPTPVPTATPAPTATPTPTPTPTNTPDPNATPDPTPTAVSTTVPPGNSGNNGNGNSGPGGNASNQSKVTPTLKPDKSPKTEKPANTANTAKPDNLRNP